VSRKATAILARRSKFEQDCIRRDTGVRYSPYASFRVDSTLLKLILPAFHNLFGPSEQERHCETRFSGSNKQVPEFGDDEQKI